MANNAITSAQAKFFYWSITSSGWSELAEVTGVEGPNMSRDTPESTPLSATDNYRVFISGLRDGGTLNFTMNFYRTDYAILKEHFESDTIQDYLILLADTDESSLEFEGWITELPLSIPLGEIVTCNVAIKVNGKPLLADGSSGGAVAPS